MILVISIFLKLQSRHWYPFTLISRKEDDHSFAVVHVVILLCEQELIMSMKTVPLLLLELGKSGSVS